MALGDWPPSPIWLPPEVMSMINEQTGPGRWWLTDSTPQQIVPTQDIRAHVFGPGCWCNPVDDGEKIVHNSADGRERYEFKRARPH